MNPREKVLASVVGLAVVLGLGYKAVDVLFIQKKAKLEERIAKLKLEQEDLERTLRSKRLLAKRWKKYAGRTFSFEEAEAQARFGAELKEIAKRFGFDNAAFSTSGGTSIGRKTGIGTVAHRIAVEGDFRDVVGFLRAIYETPCLSQITKLTLSPLGRKRGRNVVKLEFTVESPLLPRVDSEDIPQVAVVATMPAKPEEPLGCARAFVRGDDFHRILGERNILRAYLPPPENVVMIDNRDRKTVTLDLKFFWDDKVYEQLIETVKGKTSMPVKGKGGIVEILGSYADGQTFGPRRITFDEKLKQASYTVAVHTPPTLIDLAVNNLDDDKVFLEVEVTGNDNKQTTEPKMVFDPGSFDVRKYEDVKSVKISAWYASGKRVQYKTFRPSDSKQTFMVPVEPVDPVVLVDDPGDEPEPERIDPPADPAFTVTGLMYYPDREDRWQQEMIVKGKGRRQIIGAFQEGAIDDDGMLVAIVPAMGGIVQMSQTGNFYIYPLGMSFTERVKLGARSLEEVPAAIDAWSRR